MRLQRAPSGADQEHAATEADVKHNFCLFHLQAECYRPALATVEGVVPGAV